MSCLNLTHIFLMIVFIIIGAYGMNIPNPHPCLTNCEHINNIETNLPDTNTMAYLNQHNWIVVKYTDGRYYYHNLKTREDTWDWPLQLQDESQSQYEM